MTRNAFKPSAWRFGFVGCTVLLAVISASPRSRAEGPRTPEVPGILLQPKALIQLGDFKIEMPETVELNKPFLIDVRVVSLLAARGSAAVSMEQTDRVRYEPKEFRLRPGEHKKVSVTVLKSDTGLVGITANADGWASYKGSICLGQSARFRLEPGGSELNLKKDVAETVAFDFISQDTNQAVSLDGPVVVELEAERASLRERGKGAEWAPKVRLELGAGERGTPVLELRPDGKSGEKAVLRTQVRLTSGRVVHSRTFEFFIHPLWWQSMLMAVLGGLLWGLYKAGWPQERESWFRHFGKCGASSIVAGLIAYCLSNRDLLGLKLDTTTLKGFFLLGFAFAYVGVDAVLKLWMPPKKT